MTTDSVTLSHGDAWRLGTAIGVDAKHVEAWASGERTPAAWVQRVIADHLGVEPREIWPQDERRRQRTPALTYSRQS